MSTIEIPAPKGDARVELTYAGEVHFGPAYFTMRAIGFGVPFPTDTLVAQARWTPDGRNLLLTILHDVRNPDVELVVVAKSSGATRSIFRKPRLVELLEVTNSTVKVLSDRQVTSLAIPPSSP